MFSILGGTVLWGSLTDGRIILFCGGGLRCASIPRALAVSGVKRSVPSFPLKTVTKPFSCVVGGGFVKPFVKPGDVLIGDVVIDMVIGEIIPGSRSMAIGTFSDEFVVEL